MNDNRSKNSSYRRLARMIASGGLLALALAGSGITYAQENNAKKDTVTFNLAPVAQFVDCLRANPYEEPHARATVIRGKQNDTLILDLDGVKPNLTLSVFTTERTFFLTDGTKDPAFHGFGLSWYQSDVTTGKRSDDGHVQIKTVLMDDIFGFDPDVKLSPTHTFHLGLWFDDPADAQACSAKPLTPGPFNGEQSAGPLAFSSVPDAETGLGPLCTERNSSNPHAVCGQTPALAP